MRQPKATHVAITLALAFLCVLAVPYPASGPARDIEPSDGVSHPTPSPSPHPRRPPGLHTHHHGVLHNRAALMRPDEHVGSKLKAAGYATMFIGKYLNQNNELTDQQWDRHAAGWTVLDAIRGPKGSFYDYQLWTKSRTLSFGAVHSTRMVAERTVAHLRETPADVPVFAILSVYNAHTPNVPMPEFANDRRCDGMPPWRPPNFNEAEVSDKPSVPLLMWWPSVLGDEPRVIDEAVSNIDLGPTFCAIGGCTLGPYPTGQHGPDGISLVPLLDGSARMIDRGEVLESSFDADFSWFGLRTSPHNPLGRWHHVEWADGFVELYDLAADPCEVDNRAADAATAELRSTLRARLAQLLRDNRWPFRNEDTLRGSTAARAQAEYLTRRLISAAPMGSDRRRALG